MTRFIPMILAAGAALTTPAMAAPRDAPEVQLEKALKGRVAGQPQDCIQLSNVTSSEVIPRKGIIYRVGGRLYLNEPRGGVEQLDDNVILVTRTIGSQLCSIDTINLVDRNARFQRGFLQLGQFVPYTRPKAAR